MLPKTHLILGIIITLLIKLIFPQISWWYIPVIILANVLIDFDHFMVAVIRNKGDCSLKKAYEYHDGPTKYKYDFHLFHTIEFHLLIFISSVLNPIFFYIFLGMLIHSICDFIPLACTHRINEREYFFIKWYKNVKKI